MDFPTFSMFLMIRILLILVVIFLVIRIALRVLFSMLGTGKWLFGSGADRPASGVRDRKAVDAEYEVIDSRLIDKEVTSDE